MLEFLNQLFESDFMPHGQCYAWQPEILWLHATSDSLTALAYYAIPFLLIYFVRKRRDLAFKWMFVMFGAFILACGTTHLMEVWTIWNGTYRLTGVIKLFTGLISMGTAILLVPLVPKALELPSPTQLKHTNRQLQEEVGERMQAEVALQHRIALQNLIAEWSTRFINTPSDAIDDTIEKALEAIGRFVRADRSYVFLLRNDHTLMDNTHEWCADGITSQKENLQAVPCEAVPWWMHQLEHHDDIWVEDVATLPLEAQAEKDLLNEQGIQSLLVVPMVRQEELVGFVGFDAVRQQRTWSDDVTVLLGMVGDTFANALQRKQSEKALRESEERYRSVVATMTEGILLQRADRTITTCNASAERILGASRDELIGRTSLAPEWEMVRENGTSFPEEAYPNRITLQEGRPCHNVIMGLRKPNGDLRWISINTQPLFRDGDTAPNAVVVSFNDITERKRTEAKFRGLLESAPDAMVIVDEAGEIALVNEQTERLFGYAREELLGQPVESLIPDRFHDRHQKHRADYFAAPRTRPMGAELELYARHKDGSEFPVEISLSPLETEEGLLVSSAIRDITERKQAQKELRQYRDRLEDLVEERTNELARTNQQLQQEIAERKEAETALQHLNTQLEQRVRERTAELEAANHELEAFAYSVSHDLRAPLRSLAGFSRILLEQHTEELDGKAQHYLKRIRRNALNMRDLIDDLLQFSRVGRRSLEKKTTHPDELARQASDELREEQEDRSIDLHIGDLPACEADPKLLKQVYVNLLSNALKFTRHREVAAIEVGASVEDDTVTYFVSDNGTGFDMQYADKLFGVFQRLHRAEDYEGTGVGLAIVQRIIHRHGGDIWAEAQPDQGATFFFTLHNSPTHEQQTH